MKLELQNELWRWQADAPAAWYFITIPQPQAELLREQGQFLKTGFGMIPVQVKIGKTTWKTSVFPQNQNYLIPIKASVRKAEKLETGKTVKLELEVMPKSV